VKKTTTSFDPRSVVVVPAIAGPLIRLDDTQASRGEVDDVLDDLFGEPDTKGPGIADAALVVGGAGVTVAALIAAWPTAIVVGGLGALGLGSVLPLQATWRKLRSAKSSGKIRSVVRAGTLLRIDHKSTARLVHSYELLVKEAERLTPAVRQRTLAVGRNALVEVASLLDGKTPVTVAEVEYVDSRIVALDELAAVVRQPSVGDGDGLARQARLEARREVESLDGQTSLADARDLARDLLGNE
jgi:hypothetical protein